MFVFSPEVCSTWKVIFGSDFIVRSFCFPTFKGILINIIFEIFYVSESCKFEVCIRQRRSSVRTLSKSMCTCKLLSFWKIFKKLKSKRITFKHINLCWVERLVRELNSIVLSEGLCSRPVNFSFIIDTSKNRHSVSFPKHSKLTKFENSEQQFLITFYCKVSILKLRENC